MSDLFYREIFFNFPQDNFSKQVFYLILEPLLRIRIKIGIQYTEN